jgi:lipopolysaccharide/colanic/teichoic acid biosynthesis glycosyltransferase
VGKRLFDTIGSLLALAALSPFLLVIAALIKLDSPGPVFFRQQRLGRGARPFMIYKFRTMQAGASTRGRRITVHADRRVTRVGRILRRFELDELPTLFNVLRGDMSFVGPRPEVPEFLRYYSEEQKWVFTVKPGLTDPGTLAFRNEATLLVGENAERVYAREILPRKLALNLEYIKKQSLLSDAAIIVRTLTAVLFQPKG